MPRTARKPSLSNIYHVMLRGINRQNIFEEDEDRLCFMNILGQCKKLSGFRLYAFVLMSNHVHLLIEPTDESLDTIFRRIGTRYAVWYNQKYERVGHLFQDRFRSENVESDLYFMTVLRYIIQNPMKAGIENRPGTYRWSSFKAYEHGNGTVTDIQYALDLFGGRQELVDFLNQKNDDETVMDEASYDKRLRNDVAKEKMCRITQCSSVSEFQQLDSNHEKAYAREMHHAGLSLGQISRLTGMSKTTVYKAVNAPDHQDDAAETLQIREPETDFVLYCMDPDTIW